MADQKRATPQPRADAPPDILTEVFGLNPFEMTTKCDTILDLGAFQKAHSIWNEKSIEVAAAFRADKPYFSWEAARQATHGWAGDEPHPDDFQSPAREQTVPHSDSIDGSVADATEALKPNWAIFFDKSEEAPGSAGSRGIFSEHPTKVAALEHLRAWRRSLEAAAWQTQDDSCGGFNAVITRAPVNVCNYRPDYYAPLFAMALCHELPDCRYWVAAITADLGEVELFCATSRWPPPKNLVLGILCFPEWGGASAFVGGLGAALSIERCWAKLMDQHDKILATSGSVVTGLIYSVDSLLALLAGAATAILLMSATKVVRQMIEILDRKLSGSTIDDDSDTGSLT